MSLKVTVADDDGNTLDAAGLSQLAYDPAGTAGAGRNMEQKVAAQNAALTIDGIAITKSGNVVADAIQGVTLTLSKTNVGTPATLTVAASAEAGAKAVDAFVKAYNDVHKTIGSMTRYDTATRKGSVLTGDATVRAVQSKLRAIVGGAIAGGSGAAGEIATLAQVGIKTAADGTLTLHSAKLNAVLASDPASVQRLFAAVGTASDSLVGYAGATDKTQVGEYSVEVTQLATRGTLVGSAAAGLSITAGVNDTLTATIDGATFTVTIAAGVYADADALAAEVAGRINGAQAMKNAGNSVSVSSSGGVLTLTSARYGSTSSITMSGAAAATLLGAAPVSTLGLDVAGTIGGVAALGAGKTLTGATGSPAEGLRINVDGGIIGARGTLRFSQGIGALLDAALADLVEDDGLVDAKTEGVQRSLDQLDKRKDALEARLERVEEAYRKQYVALDAQISQMSTLSSYLAQQLANLPKPYDDGGK
jgi:flagellar hook-associated protein 2